jgi:hypothetical protein
MGNLKAAFPAKLTAEHVNKDGHPWNPLRTSGYDSMFKSSKSLDKKLVLNQSCFWIPHFENRDHFTMKYIKENSPGYIIKLKKPT